MKVVILAGGFGSRLSELTESIPKPMVTIGGIPILLHIMNYYSQYGFKEFIIALGYKSNVIKEYFLNYSTLNSDFTIDLSNGDIVPIQKKNINWKISLIDTGLNTMTGGRLKKLENLLKDETFMLTYGDGLSDVDLHKLIEFHKKNKKMVTVTAVRPLARFGELTIDHKNDVISFQEKPQTIEGWINGGFFVINSDFLSLIDNDQTILERDPLEKIVSKNQMSAYTHRGFWQCMDTKRDRDKLEEIFNSNNIPWIKSDQN